MTIVGIMIALGFCLSIAMSGYAPLLRIHDTPNHRSLHIKVTPSSGGMGIVAGTAGAIAGLLYFAPGLFEDMTQIYLLGGMGLIIAAIGLLDDVFTLPGSVKFIVIGLICIAAPLVTGLPERLPLGGGQGWDFPLPLSHFGAALWMFVVINAVNFMDGSNGMLAVNMGIAASGLVIIGALTQLWVPAMCAACLMAGIVGFMPYNARTKARIFSGDVGSLFVGYCFAVLSLMLTTGSEGGALLYVGPLLILPFLTDILLTMLRRARGKENLMQAHRSHLYQRLIQSGRTHLGVTSSYGFAGIIAISAAVLGGFTGLLSSPAYFLGWVCLAIVTYYVTSQALKKKR